MQNKKGAIELSMTTIIVIVIGVALLSFGLIFVNKIRTGVTGISDQTFDEAQTLLSEGLSDVTKFLTISPDSITLQPGKDKAVKVILLNQEDKDITATLTTTAIKDDKLKCLFFDTKDITSSTYTIKSGAQETIPLVAQDLDGGIRTTGCRVIVNGGPTNGNQGTLLVRIDKGK